MLFFYDPDNQSDRSGKITNYELAKFRRERPVIWWAVTVLFYGGCIVVPYTVYLVAKGIYKSYIEQTKEQDRVSQARARITKRAAELEEQHLQITKVSG